MIFNCSFQAAINEFSFGISVSEILFGRSSGNERRKRFVQYSIGMALNQRKSEYLQKIRIGEIKRVLRES
jgi:hypothetical protein